MIRRWSNLSTSFKRLGNFYPNLSNFYSNKFLKFNNLNSLNSLLIFHVKGSLPPLIKSTFNSRSLLWFKKSYSLRTPAIILLNFCRQAVIKHSLKLSSILHFFLSNYELNITPPLNQISFYLKPTDGSFIYLAHHDFKIFKSLKFRSLFLQIKNNIHQTSSTKVVLKNYQTSMLYYLEFLRLLFNSLKFKQNWLGLPYLFLFRKSGLLKLINWSSRNVGLQQLTSEFFLLKRSSWGSTKDKNNLNSFILSHRTLGFSHMYGFYLLKSKLDLIYTSLLRLFLLKISNF